MNFLLYFMALVFLQACGSDGGVGSTEEENPEATDPAQIQSDSDLSCEGATSATLTDGSVSVQISSGQIDPCANATPTLSLVSVDDSLLATGETSISSGGDAVQVNLTADFDATTVPDDSDPEATDVTITLPYSDSSVGSGKENSQNIYVLAHDQDNDTVVPLVGDLNTSSNTITVPTKGLPANTVFTVVYNPNMTAVASDSSSLSSLHTALTLSTWPTNVWCVIYDPTHATLRSVVAGILETTDAALTAAQIQTVVGERVAVNARVSGSEFQALGFRAPHLYVQSANAATRACSGTNSPVYFIHMVYGGNSFFRADDPAENADVDTLAGFGTKFGRLYIDAGRLDDEGSTGLGTVEASIAHEMFHGVQAGYEIYRSGKRVMGITEGTAATIGSTLDGEGTRESEPQVRDFSDEIFSLANYLLISGEDYRYSNQDFFAYVARRYNNNSFDFLPSYFAIHRNKIAALTTATAITQPPYATLYDALEDGLQTGVSATLTLPAAYFDFAVNRLVEHNGLSQFGRAGETTAAGTLATNLLNGSFGLLVPLQGDPDSLDLTKTSNRMGSFSTRVFKIVPTEASENENGMKLTVTITPTSGDVGDEMRVKYYRAGSAVGTEASSSSFEIRNWAKTTADQIIVVVSNTQAAYGVRFTYKAVTEDEEEEENSFEATIRINGINYDFSPRILRAGFGSFTGEVVRSGLPSVFASEGSSLTDLSQAILNITTDPNDIDLENSTSYSMAEMGDVFENNIGSATILFHTPDITDVDDGSQVLFDSTGGTITFTSYGDEAGERLAATFSATVSGERTIGINEDGTKEKETLIGTITGSFNMVLE